MGRKQAASPIRSLAKQLVPGGIRRSRRRKGKVAKQLKQGCRPDVGFMHIPKTGGSGIQELCRKLAANGQPFPCCFPHRWTFGEIHRRFPKIRVALILRDPLERTISSFNSRLRQGRPTYQSPWKPAEAAAFAHFPDIRRYLDALIADDDLSLSACAYAQRHVRHLHWNYRYYFGNAEAVRENAASITLLGRIEETDAFIDALLAEAGLAPESVAGLYERRHEAQIRPSKVLAGYSEGDIARMRAHLADEYAIYHALLALGCEPHALDAPAA
jgi:hypothetical protein